MINSIDVDGKPFTHNDWCIPTNDPAYIQFAGYLEENYCRSDNKADVEMYNCPNGCKDGACIGGDNVKEQVKCIFDGATEDNKCYSDAGFSCHGIGSCVTDVYGSKGQQLAWKSSCGGYAYTVIDGQSEYANFYCKPTFICGNGVCEMGESQQSCPQDCVKNCPILIDMSFNKEVYYPGDYFEVTIKLYDYSKNLMPNHAFNLYYTNNGNEYPTSTMYTDSTGIYKSSSQIPKDFHDFGEFIFVASSTDEGCNYVYDKENIHINILGSCGDNYCSNDEKELVCTTTCATCPVEPTSATSSAASAAITGAITAATTKDVSTCGCSEYCYVKCARDCTPSCGNGVCDTIACLAVGCPVPENEKNCPNDCGTINYCGSQSQDYNCVCQEGFKKEKFEASCSTVTETASSTAITETNNKICTDSDDGKSYYVKGTVTASNLDRGSESDKCFGEYTSSGPTESGPYVSEGFCTSGGAGFEFYRCPNGCNDGACIKANTCTYYRCIPSFTYLNLQTDKYYYDIGEQVAISTNRFDKEKMTLQELTVYVKDPYGNLQEIVMKPECNTAEECPLCKPGGYCPPCSSVTTCQFNGVYSGTKTVGSYSVKSERSMNSAYFRVYDYSLLKKYLILSDIDGYIYKDSNLMQGSEDITVYVARYEKSGKIYDAMVGEFESRDVLNKYLSEILKYNPPSEEKFGDQFIYVIKSGNQKVYFWTQDSFLIVINEEMYAQMSGAAKSVIASGVTETSASISATQTAATTSAASGGFFTGMITGVPVAVESSNSFKHCGADSLSSECACMEGETKEEFMPSCKQGSECEMVLHYRCVQRDPTELINAYLDKYPSDIKATGTGCETKNGYCIYFQDSCKDGFEDSALACKTKSEKCCVKEVDKEDFLEISLKLESMRVSMDKFETKANALADYYKKSGDEQRAAKFQEVAGMLSMAKEKIDRIITKIKDNMDDLESVREEIKSDIKGLRSYIRNILVKMVS
ncbi:MAG: hypothetical protein V1648_05130 [Candidatus Aenigmatarchaeota archaeon]